MTTEMTTDMLLALAAYAFAATWTPGPNNMMLAASGATFGWRRTVPHAMGVALGFPLMVFAVSLGLGGFFRAAPAFQVALGWVGCAVMLWLAWRIATAEPPAEEGGGGHSGGRGQPLSFVGASAFQWVNPKAWIMCIGVSASFAGRSDPVGGALVIAGVFVLAGLSSSQAWALFGTAMGRLLGRGWRLRAFNIAMAALLAVSALWLVLVPPALPPTPPA